MISVPELRIIGIASLFVLSFFLTITMLAGGFYDLLLIPLLIFSSAITEVFLLRESMLLTPKYCSLVRRQNTKSLGESK